MSLASAEIIKKTAFVHKFRHFDVIAFVSSNSPFEFQVQVLEALKPVVITYPDRHKATLIYTVSMPIRMELKRLQGWDAIDMLMMTAESDAKSLI